MSQNKRVSELLSLAATDIQSNDVFFVTDTSQRESKQLEVGQLLLFVENSGSFPAYKATLADTASYIDSSNIHGIVAVATISSQSISSSYAGTVISASHAIQSDTASYSAFCVTTMPSADTASFLKYTGTPNGTSSYSVKANSADSSTTTLNLFYSGLPNGTASYSMNGTSASYSIISSNSTSASHAVSSDTSNYSISSGTSATANFATFATTAGQSTTTINADTASYIALGTPSLRAFAMVTGSDASNKDTDTLTIVTGCNISSVVSLGTLAIYSGSNHTQFCYGVTFLNPINTTNYIIVGNAWEIAGTNGAEVGVVFLPQTHSMLNNRSTTSFTMSIQGTWDNTPNEPWGMNFQVIGY